MAWSTLNSMAPQLPLPQSPSLRDSNISSIASVRRRRDTHPCDRCRSSGLRCSGDPGDGTCKMEGHLDACNLTPVINDGPNARNTGSPNSPIHSALALNLVVGGPRPTRSRTAASHLGPPDHAASYQPIYDRRVQLPSLPTMGLPPLDGFTEPSRWAVALSNLDNNLPEPTNMALWALQSIDNSPFTSLPLPGCDEMLSNPALSAVQSDIYETRPHANQHVGTETGRYVPMASAAREFVYQPGQEQRVEDEKSQQHSETFTLAFRNRCLIE
ncbi:hypothetical protein DE146DRAFT_731189 [Phaeosphaeria sp. MPI-PUGE-AT-0046c]|nr:hypothetical protein DE146DRAFT_731189 [Phaeosphaeria sp. MPI-PUGE-AT-0046c]